MTDDLSPPGAGGPPLPREVAEAEAHGVVARIYDEVRQALRSPTVNLVYRLLAAYPEYLAAAWAQIGPNLASCYVEREAERLRAISALEVGPAGEQFRRELSALDPSAGDLAQIRDTIDLFNYVNPKNLIAIAALRLALEGQSIPGTNDAEAGQPVPSGPLPNLEVRLVDTRSAAPEARAMLTEIPAAHQAGALPSVYRALANWPAFLRLGWQAVRPFVRGPEFAARVRGLIDEAERAALHLPYRVELSRAEVERLVGRQGAASIGEILRQFETVLIPAMTVEIHTLKALLDGRAAARTSPLAWRG